jgi:acetylglutamate kinase
VPVLASLGQADGALLNVNADDFAAAVASALGAEALVLLSDTPGLLLGGAIVPGGGGRRRRRLLASPEVTGGMAPKLEAARAATASGACEAGMDRAVERAQARWRRCLSGQGTGTRIAEGVAHD